MAPLRLFGKVASDATAFRVIDSVDEQGLARLRCAVALARSRAWKLGARPARRDKQDAPERTVLDVDATLTTAYSEKEEAAAEDRRWRDPQRAARRAGTDDRRQLLDCLLDHRSVLPCARSGPSICSKSAETFPWIAITLRAFSRSASAHPYRSIHSPSCSSEKPFLHPVINIIDRLFTK
ncbi:MAG: hypothetical protein ACLP0J_09190 [Solirubrobacteraceae bacterium]